MGLSSEWSERMIRQGEGCRQPPHRFRISANQVSFTTSMLTPVAKEPNTCTRALGQMEVTTSSILR